MKTNNVLSTIAALNLEPIKNKLMDVEHGEGWSRAKVEAMDLEYRRFLHLMHTFPHESASPTKAVDTFWHYHILDTQKYAADCDYVFGCFMHHNPYGNEGTASRGVNGGDLMQELYEATFREAYMRAEAYDLDLETGETALMEGLCAGAWAQPGLNQAERMLRTQAHSAIAAIRTARCYGFCGMVAKPTAASAALYTQQSGQVTQTASIA